MQVFKETDKIYLLNQLWGLYSDPHSDRDPISSENAWLHSPKLNRPYGSERKILQGVGKSWAQEQILQKLCAALYAKIWTFLGTDMTLMWKY